MRLFTWIAAAALSTLSCCAAIPQDATVAAPNNYKVELENELVRIVRVTYAPHEKSPMHEHQGNPAVIVVLKGGGRMHFVYPDGTTSEGMTEKASSVRFVPERKPFKHAGENAADDPIEVVRVELKASPQSLGDNAGRPEIFDFQFNSSKDWRRQDETVDQDLPRDTCPVGGRLGIDGPGGDSLNRCPT